MKKKKCSSEAAAQDYISPHKISELLDVPYARVLAALQLGYMSAVKIKKHWFVTEGQYAKFKAANSRKIKHLQEDYFALYRQGLTHYQLQRRVSSDFSRLGIIYPISGFAEQTIYEKLKAGELQ